MPSTFMTAPQYFFTSESVSEGHPDKICDQISDGVLDAILTQDPAARVACEAATTTGLVVVIGEITTSAYVDIEAIARQTLADIGYTCSEVGFDAQTCGVLISVHEQSPDIKAGVDTALEARGEETGQDELEATGAGDQGMMIGFACDETAELMPLTASLSHRLMRRLAAARKSGDMAWLRPDAKCQVTVEYAHGIPQRIDTIVVSTQHASEITQTEICRQIIGFIQRDEECAKWVDADTIYHINPSGRFVMGGPMGDAGLTGRKIIVDTYGGVARHGGGAFSGKDATKVDRSAAYMARYVAKNVVAAGLARRFELQLSYAIGKAEPTSLAVETFGTGLVNDAVIERLIRHNFDMRPEAIIRQLGLRRPIFQQVAAYGHFGREDLAVPWEQTDQAAVLREQAGLD